MSLSFVSEQPDRRPAKQSRYKSAVACNECRRRKLKCDGIRPICGRCQKDSRYWSTCVFGPVSGTVLGTSSGSRGGNDPRNRPATTTPTSITTNTLAQSQTQSMSSTSSTAAGAAPASTSAASPPLPPADVRSDPEEGTDKFRISGPIRGGTCQFAVKVEQAINEKLDLLALDKWQPAPLLDVPLFGSIAAQQLRNATSTVVENVLPTRKQADQLLVHFWQHFNSIEQILDYETFTRSYERLFNGIELDCDETIFVSTLNVVFALASQLQLSNTSAQRDEAARTFFLRAWSLLRPQSIFWRQGSLELVQCLLLMSHYLRCTGNVHQTWLAIGLAVRLAQGIGLNAIETSLPGYQEKHTTQRRVWQGCVFMDRTISWPIGQSPIVPLNTTTIPDSFSHRDLDLSTAADSGSELFTALLQDLNEIVSHIICMQHMSLNAERVSSSEQLRLADHGTTVEIDDHLTTIGKSIPPHNAFDSPRYGQAGATPSYSGRGRWLLLQLRLAHARTILFRPMLARLCFAHAGPDRRHGRNERVLNQRILQDCSMLCVDNARRIITLLYEQCTSNTDSGPLQWWYRFFYLHVAAQIQVAALFRPSIFAPILAASWPTTMLVFEALRPLSPAVNCCKEYFQKLWDKVSSLPRPEVAAQNLGPEATFSNNDVQEIFHQLGFEAQHTLADLDEIMWLDSIDWPTYPSEPANNGHTNNDLPTSGLGSNPGARFQGH